jgi:hypothetical protein
MQYLAEKDDIQTVIHDQIDTTVEAQMPLGYLIPSAWKQIADLLALHGVEMERTAKPLTQEFETYRFSGITWTNGPQEGHIMLGNFDARLVKEKMTIPEGSYWVPMKQRRARLILATLEPQAPDSFARWGLMYQVFEGGGGVAARGWRGTRGGARRRSRKRDAGRISFRADRAQDHGRQSRTGQGVSGESGVRPGFRRRPHRAPPMVVPAFEVRAFGQRTLPHRAGVGKELVRNYWPRMHTDGHR